MVAHCESKPFLGVMNQELHSVTRIGVKTDQVSKVFEASSAFVSLRRFYTSPTTIHRKLDLWLMQNYLCLVNFASFWSSRSLLQMDTFSRPSHMLPLYMQPINVVVHIFGDYPLLWLLFVCCCLHMFSVCIGSCLFSSDRGLAPAEGTHVTTYYPCSPPWTQLSCKSSCILAIKHICHKVALRL